ncbi:hypothetical protein J6590_067832 [Homalodisca vitripennis]|nr:hypothetical protein J6590_067832 [Homalodisca vitripennis]
MHRLDERSILSERVRLDNGQQAQVFSTVKKQDSVWYTCHVCSDTVVGLPQLRQHVESKKHQTNMMNPVHPRAKFIKLDPKENVALEPGEPVPPGLEEVIIKNCIIQPKLDASKSAPLIGLEFMIELTESSLGEGTYYYCLLCDKNGTERNIFIHFTSVFHYMKYLSVYFPTVARKLQSLPNRKVKKSFGLLVTEIVADIEAKYGRLKPRSETHADFHAPGRKDEILMTIRDGPHFKETDGELFDEKATAENVDKKNKELCAPPPPSKIEETGKLDEKKELTGSKFNKINRINMDKKQLRSRDETNRNSSPDVQVIDIQLPKSPEKKRRSRSLSSISTVSSSSSLSRNRNRYHRHHSKLSNNSRSHRNWSRSRSRSPGYYRYRRRVSPSYPKRYSPGRRSRDRSPVRRYDRRGYSPDKHRVKETDRFGRSRDAKYRREKTEDRSPGSTEEKIRWAKFREDLTKIETVKLEKLKYHEKNPEKHPQYPEEWKAFWNRRYNELQRSGIDPSKHDFKPEWISFWTKRMKELYEEDLGKAKDELKKKFDLPEDPVDHMERNMPWRHSRKRNTSPGLVDISPPTPDKKDVIADIKTTWKAFTGSDIKDTPKRPLSPWEDEGKSRDYFPPSKRDSRSRQSRSQSPTQILNDKLLEDMPQRKTRTSSLIFVLRKLTVLEPQLGSLAPKVFEILTQSLALEKIKEDASLDLLFDIENCVFLETVREKLIALLCAGVVPRNVVNTARSAIKHIDISLYLASKRERTLPIETLRSGVAGNNQSLLAAQYIPQPKLEPVVVPGVGQVDKIAIAQQIAAALVEQGKTNVTESELEQLINAVVGMAEASVNSTQPMTTAHFLHQLQSTHNTSTAQVVPTSSSMFHPKTDVSSQPQSIVSNSQPEAAYGALKLLQSAYNDTMKSEQESPKPENSDNVVPTPSKISDQELAATLSAYNNMNKDDQPNFIQNLQSSNPEMYNRLRPFIPANVTTVSDHSKRSPITISLSKEKSEQKIKPLASGRLSPFSSRSGGANPTVGEEVILEDDDDEKTDVKFVSESKTKPQSSNLFPDISKYKSDRDEEEDDDDDDDDYSFEDVCKAAQEKLRQKQVEEDKQIPQSVDKKEINTNKTFGSSVTKSVLSNIDKSSELLSKNHSSSNSSNQINNIRNEQSTQQLIQQPINPEKISEIQSFNSQPTPFHNAGTSSTTNFQEQMRNQQQSVKLNIDPAHQSYDDGSYQNYQNRNSNEQVYPKPINESYDNSSNYYAELPYSSFNKETYPQRTPYETPSRDVQRDPYEAPYRDQYNYNAPSTNLAYGNHMNTYDDQYRYNDGSYGGDNFNTAHPYERYPQTNYPNPPAPSQRYPYQNYPPY